MGRKRILNILLIALLASISTAFGQNKTYIFLPKWQVGESKKLSITQKETEYKKGKLVEDTTTYLSATIYVLSETNADYTLKVLYENIALKIAKEFYEKLGDELTDYRNLELKYKVSKQTGKIELLNWKESQQFMNNSFEQIDILLKKNVPEMAGMAKLAFSSIREMFESKENIESYMTDEIGYLFFPYNKKLVQGDTLSITQLCANPLNPTDTINQTTVAFLDNINESKNTCDIHTKDILDLTEFKKMMVTMMESIGSAFNIEDSSKTKAAKEINSIEFDVTREALISFDYKTSWPTKIIKSAKIVATDPRGRTDKTILTTINIQ